MLQQDPDVKTGMELGITVIPGTKNSSLLPEFLFPPVAKGRLPTARVPNLWARDLYQSTAGPRSRK